jgi:5,10-methylenetetrahydromethanopterin reductase
VSVPSFGLGLQSNKRPGAYAALARQAEADGFDVVSVFNDLFFQPALPALLEIAQATERVRVGLLDRFAFAGEPARIVEQARALFDAGADRIEFGTPHGIDELRGVELLGSQVLAELL